MEVILLERVENLGNVGEIVKVKDGYARNFLIPQGKVLRANNENKALFETKKAEIEKANSDKKAAAEKDAKKISDKFVVLIRQAGEDGRLYGSVAARDISDLIKELGVEVSKSQVSLAEPIKYLGVYPQKVSLHAEVPVTVNVNVARSESEAKEAEKLFLNPPKEENNEEAAEAKEADQA